MMMLNLEMKLEIKDADGTVEEEGACVGTSCVQPYKLSKKTFSSVAAMRLHSDILKLSLIQC